MCEPGQEDLLQPLNSAAPSPRGAHPEDHGRGSSFSGHAGLPRAMMATWGGLEKGGDVLLGVGRGRCLMVVMPSSKDGEIILCLALEVSGSSARPSYFYWQVIRVAC